MPLLAPLIAGFGWSVRVGSLVLSTLGFSQLMDWFNPNDRDGQNGVRGLVSLVGLLVVALVLVLAVAKGLLKIPFIGGRR